MKKICYLFILVVFLFPINLSNIYAKETSSETTITVNEVDIKDFSNNPKHYYIEKTENNTATIYNKKIISGKKTITYKHNDTILWMIEITGTFMYTGHKAECIHSSISYNSYDTSWTLSNAIATKNKNQAIGEIIGKNYFLGLCTQTINESITLTCSNTGELS